jgi:hypothetical protein
MVGRAQSIAKKSILKQKCKNLALGKAMATWAKEQEKPQKEHCSICLIAMACGTKPPTLWQAATKKNIPHAEAQIANWKLSLSQDCVLVNFIKEMADRSLPLTHEDMHEYAEGILNVGKCTKVILGHNQIPHFLDRHSQEISMHWSSKQAGGLTPAAVKKHFKWVKDMEIKYKIAQELDYGMDETPMLLGCPGKQ